MRSPVKLLQSSYFDRTASAQLAQITPIAGRAICGLSGFLKDARSSVQIASGFQGQKMFFRVYASQKFHKMRRSLMFRKTLIPALVVGAAFLVAGPSPASASLFSYGGGCGGCGGCNSGCGYHHHHVHHHHHGCGCGYSSCGCGAPAPSCCAPAPSCCAPAPTCAAPAPMACAPPAPPTCAAPAPTCCAPAAPSCCAPAAPSCAAPGGMAPAPRPVQAAPAPPPEEPAPKPKA
jgi:hypothetical protein